MILLAPGIERGFASLAEACAWGRASAPGYVVVRASDRVILAAPMRGGR